MLLGKKKRFYSAQIILPVSVYLLTLGYAEILSWLGNCHGWWEVCWSRYDSGLYLEISELGHTLKNCGIENGYVIGSEKWCGNAGWAPFYPFLIYLFHHLSTLSPAVCGILLSHTFFIAFLVMMAKIINVHSFKLSNWLTLLLCALCPGGIYFFSIFPISLLIFLVSIVFWSFYFEKYYYSVLPAYLIALSYSSAIIIFFSFGVYMIYLFFSSWKQKRMADFLVEILKQWYCKNSYKNVLLYLLIPGIIGLISLYLYDWFVTGHWNAMYLVQNKYGHLLYSPFKHLEIHYKLLISHQNSSEIWIDIHNIFFFFTLPILVYFLAKNKNRITPLLILYTLIMWYIPFSIGINVSLYRSIALLAPVLAFIDPLKNLQKLLILIAFGIFYYFLGILFVLSILH